MNTTICKCLCATLSASAILSTGITLASAQDFKAEKVEICHKGQTIEVASPAVVAHLAHGDATGACEDTSSSSVSSSVTSSESAAATGSSVSSETSSTASGSLRSGSGSDTGTGSNVDDGDKTSSRGPFFGIIHRIDVCHDGELVSPTSFFNFIMHILHGDSIEECESDEDDGESSSSISIGTGSTANGSGSLNTGTGSDTGTGSNA